MPLSSWEKMCQKFGVGLSRERLAEEILLALTHDGEGSDDECADDRSAGPMNVAGVAEQDFPKYAADIFAHIKKTFQDDPDALESVLDAALDTHKPLGRVFAGVGNQSLLAEIKAYQAEKFSAGSVDDLTSYRSGRDDPAASAEQPPLAPGGELSKKYKNRHGRPLEQYSKAADSDDEESASDGRGVSPQRQRRPKKSQAEKNDQANTWQPRSGSSSF